MTEVERRNSWQVMKDLLLVAKGGARITQIVYRGNSNFRLVKAFLDLLKMRGLIVEGDPYWITTEKGDEFILRVLELEAMLT